MKPAEPGSPRSFVGVSSKSIAEFLQTISFY